jgi:hypothetical protein
MRSKYTRKTVGIDHDEATLVPASDPKAVNADQLLQCS